MELSGTDFLSGLAAIVLLDLVLAGDNAIVIALAARNLPRQIQKKAVLWGTVGAIAVRLLMTAVVVYLLKLPGLMLAGGLLLLPIAWKLLQQEAEDFERDAAALSERARLLYEEIGSRLADRSNRALSALTVISTLLLPPTFVVGAFGMNVGGIPWAQSPEGFWAALGFCFVLVLSGWALLRRFRILP